MSPSDDIAYKTLGKGNIAPSRLVERPNKAPMDTTQPTKGQPTCKNKSKSPLKQNYTTWLEQWSSLTDFLALKIEWRSEYWTSDEKKHLNHGLSSQVFRLSIIQTHGSY